MTKLTPLSIEGSWLFESSSHEDDRGYFREWFKSSVVTETLGRQFNVSQSNLSRSKKGVVRGIHFSMAPSGQAKWVTCANGSLWDVIVDIRPESPTFKRWEVVELRADEGKALFISEGLGHAFLSLEDDTVTSYLLTTPYSPTEEFAINPKDSEIAIKWPDMTLLFSDKDAGAPSLKEFLSSL
jgi:dTDP-4-dehydrorhamnose 3,5-epimerase